MTNEEAIELLKNMHWSITTKMNREVPSSLALLMAIKALDKDINVPSNSALDHIHNVVAEREYQRGYEQGKADANHPEIPDSWIPCSERLPEEGQEILATTVPNGWYDVVIIRTYYAMIHKSVIAWMPLPEPWKGE